VQHRKRLARERRQHASDNARLEPFLDFWSGLSAEERTEFEIRALTDSDSLKRHGYYRLRETGGPAFEQYRQVILRDYFEKTKPNQAA